MVNKVEATTKNRDKKVFYYCCLEEPHPLCVLRHRFGLEGTVDGNTGM